ncbi:MAG: hypothetical protein U0575_15470 [Phycisphaerales bacterium]
MFAAMYAAAREAIGAAVGRLETCAWATLMAVGIEVCLLLAVAGLRHP